MSISHRRRLAVQQRPVAVDVGCACRRPILSTLLSASFNCLFQKQRIPKLPGSSSPSATNATFSSFDSSSRSSPAREAATTGSQKKKKQNRDVKGRKSDEWNGVVEESVAMVKESSNPYIDFYESMLVMIVEKEIYGWEELCLLLRRYLSLNSPCHHHTILRAFADIWKNVVSPVAATAAASGLIGKV